MQELAAGWQGAGPERTPDSMQGIAQAVPGVGFVALRPEQRDEPLPGAAEATAHDQHRQDRFGAALGQGGHRGADGPSSAKPPSTRSRIMLMLAAFLTRRR